MNSEITSVSKLVPVTAVKTESGGDERSLSSVNGDKPRLDFSMAALQSDTSLQTSNLTQIDKNKKNTESKLSVDSVKKAADEGNSLLQSINRDLQFKVDDTTKELVVKIVDSKSGELVRQIPSEEMLTFIRRMQELEGQQGSMIQDRA